jgi:hypothetical protein
MRRYEEALKLINYLQEVLKPGVSAERDYLRGYLSELAHFAIANSGSHTVRSELEPLLNIELRQIELQRVPAHIKRNFPLPGHPKWQ